MLGHGLAFPRSHDFDLRLRCGAEIVDMGEFDAGSENGFGFEVLGKFRSLALTHGKLAQMIAAFQPDSSQVVIQIRQLGAAAHFQIQPELALIRRLYAEVIKRFARAFLAAGLFDSRSALGAGGQMLVMPLLVVSCPQ